MSNPITLAIAYDSHNSSFRETFLWFCYLPQICEERGNLECNYCVLFCLATRETILSLASKIIRTTYTSLYLSKPSYYFFIWKRRGDLEYNCNVLLCLVLKWAILPLPIQNNKYKLHNSSFWKTFLWFCYLLKICIEKGYL